MWDVIWTDPDRQLVKEHRAKKEERKALASSRNDSNSRRNSRLTTTSTSSSESPFRLFRSRCNNRPVVERFARGPSPSTPGTTSPSFFSSLSPFSQVFESKSRRSSGLMTTAPPSPVAERSRPDRKALCHYMETSLDQKYGPITYNDPSIGDGRCPALELASTAGDLRRSNDNNMNPPLLNATMMEIENTGKLMELLQNLSEANQDASTSPSLECTVSDADSDSELGLDHLIAEFCLPPRTMYNGFVVLSKQSTG